MPPGGVARETVAGAEQPEADSRAEGEANRGFVDASQVHGDAQIHRVLDK